MRRPAPSRSGRRGREFDQATELYLKHLRWLTVQFFNNVPINYGSLWSYCPCPLLSVAVEGCDESGRDLTNGGTKYHLIAHCAVYLAPARRIGQTRSGSTA